MNSAQVCVFIEWSHIGLGCLLECQHCWALNSEFLSEGVGDLTDQSLEGKLADEELGCFLVFSYLAEGHGSWSESIGPLYAVISWSWFSGYLIGDQLFPWYFLGCWFPCCLFRSCHKFLKAEYSPSSPELNLSTHAYRYPHFPKQTRFPILINIFKKQFKTSVKEPSL